MGNKFDSKGFSLIETLISTAFISILLANIIILLNVRQNTITQKRIFSFMFDSCQVMNNQHLSNHLYFTDVNNIINDCHPEPIYSSTKTIHQYYLYYDDFLNPVSKEDASFYLFVRHQMATINKKNVYLLYIDVYTTASGFRSFIDSRSIMISASIDKDEWAQ